MRSGTIWTFRAPPDAATLYAVCGGVRANVPVSDGRAVLTSETTTKFPDGVCQTEWVLTGGGVLDGPRFNVRGSISQGAQVALTFPEQMVQKLEQTLLTMAGDGATSVDIPDGGSVSFESREEVRAALAHWKEQVRIDRGTRVQHTVFRPVQTA